MYEISACLNYKCNMNCKSNYCYITELKNKKIITMPERIAFKGLDFSISLMKISNTKVIDLHLYGGEPFLNYSLIKKIISYIITNYESYVKKGNIRVSIFTNGLLLDVAKFSFLTNYNLKFNRQDFINIGISFDGDPFMQAKNRNNPEIVENNLKSLKRYYQSLDREESSFRNIFLLWTLTPASINNFFQSFLYLFEDLEIQEFVHCLTLQLAYCVDWPKSMTKIVKNQTRKILNYVKKSRINRFSIIIKPPLNFNCKVKDWRQLYYNSCLDSDNLNCPTNFINILPNGDLVRCNCTYISEIFKTPNPLMFGNLKKLDLFSKYELNNIIKKLGNSHRTTLREMVSFLKEKSLYKNFKKKFLSNSTRVCSFRYRNQDSIRNFSRCKKTMLKEIFNFSKKFNSKKMSSA